MHPLRRQLQWFVYGRTDTRSRVLPYGTSLTDSSSPQEELDTAAAEEEGEDGLALGPHAGDVGILSVDAVWLPLLRSPVQDGTRRASAESHRRGAPEAYGRVPCASERWREKDEEASWRSRIRSAKFQGLSEPTSRSFAPPGYVLVTLWVERGEGGYMIASISTSLCHRGDRNRQLRRSRYICEASGGAHCCAAETACGGCEAGKRVSLSLFLYLPFFSPRSSPRLYSSRRGSEKRSGPRKTDTPGTAPPQPASARTWREAEGAVVQKTGVAQL